MRVTLSNWRGEREMELEDALTPESSSDRGGVAERAQDQADANAKAIGRLAALLVDRRLISLDEACTACGIYDTVTPADDD